MILMKGIDSSSVGALAIQPAHYGSRLSVDWFGRTSRRIMMVDARNLISETFSNPP